MCLWADSEALKQYMIQPYIFAFERLSSSLSSCCARANSVNHRVRRVRRVAQLFWFNSNTYRRLKFTGQNSETNELVNIGVVALDMNKYTFTEGHVVLHCNQHPVATKYATLMMMNPKGRNQKIKINLENFKFGRGEIRSDDLPIKEPGFLPTCLQHFGAGYGEV